MTVVPDGDHRARRPRPVGLGAHRPASSVDELTPSSFGRMMVDRRLPATESSDNAIGVIAAYQTSNVPFAQTVNFDPSADRVTAQDHRRAVSAEMPSSARSTRHHFHLQNRGSDGKCRAEGSDDARRPAVSKAVTLAQHLGDRSSYVGLRDATLSSRILRTLRSIAARQYGPCHSYEPKSRRAMPVAAETSRASPVGTPVESMSAFYRPFTSLKRRPGRLHQHAFGTADHIDAASRHD